MHVTAWILQCRASKCVGAHSLSQPLTTKITKLKRFSKDNLQTYTYFLQSFYHEALVCLSCPSCCFVIQTVAVLCFISGLRQTCGLLTFRNAKLWSFAVLCTHKHKQTCTFQRGPSGVGNRKWSNLPLLVSEL